MARPDSKGFDGDFDIWTLDTPELEELRRRRQQGNVGPRFEYDISGGAGDRDFDSLGYRRSESSNLITSSDRSTPVPGITIHRVEEDPAQTKIVTLISEQFNLLCGHVLMHPLVSFRRQCQVSRKALRYHLTPITVVPVIFRLRANQGIACLWKGVGSVLLVKGMALVAESAIHETTSLNKEMTLSKLTLESLTRHLSLKGLAIVIVTPFFCASLVETVQSSIAIESPSVLDTLREGLFRLSHWTSSGSTRLMPIWSIWAPAILYGIGHYSVCSLSSSIYQWILIKIREFSEDEEEPITAIDANEQQILSDLLGNLTADVLMYPIETVYHRLCLQGTRTIIDSVDMPGTVVPIISNYDNFNDCYNTIIDEEGAAGLFKGFGTLIVQYTLHFTLLKLTRIALKQMSTSY